MEAKENIKTIKEAVKKARARVDLYVQGVSYSMREKTRKNMEHGIMILEDILTKSEEAFGSPYINDEVDVLEKSLQEGLRRIKKFEEDLIQAIQVIKNNKDIT